MPLEAIGNGLKTNLDELRQTLGEVKGLASDTRLQLVPQFKTDLESLQRTLAAAERGINSAESSLFGPNAAAQQSLRDALQEVARAARSLRTLTDYLERHPDALLRGKSNDNTGDAK
jgi:paraquat-inducible protein B